MSVEPEKFEFLGEVFQIERRARRKYLTLLVRPGHGPLIRVNKGTGLEEILKFVQSKSGWLLKNLEKTKALSVSLTEGSKFFWLGRARQIVKTITPLGKTFFRLHEEHLQVYIPVKRFAEFDLVDPVKQFLGTESENYLGPRLYFWAQQMGLSPSKCQFRNQKSRWGSCSAEGVITMNRNLIVFPQTASDYVLIHELAHLKVPNHSARFWNLVAHYCPDYKAEKKKLRQFPTIFR